MKSLIVSLLLVASMSACTDDGTAPDGVKYSYVNAKVIAIDSWCWGRYCSSFAYNAGLITPENDALIIKRGFCSKNPEDMKGKDVQVLKTEKTTQDGRVEVKYDLCI